MRCHILYTRSAGEAIHQALPFTVSKKFSRFQSTEVLTLLGEADPFNYRQA